MRTLMTPATAPATHAPHAATKKQPQQETDEHDGEYELEQSAQDAKSTKATHAIVIGHRAVSWHIVKAAALAWRKLWLLWLLLLGRGCNVAIIWRRCVWLLVVVAPALTKHREVARGCRAHAETSAARSK